MELFVFSLVILACLAVFDLTVGVSNDAANFLNSSIGSRVAPRHVIMIIASLGILAGVTFSSGMMEVARKGIFHPQFFTMPELIAVFLAVMLTDVLLLDLFNTFGLPTSTTVSIVFELLGAAVAASLIKIYAAEADYATLVDYINTGKALAIILGILLSVITAFIFGAIVQFFARLLFTFDYAKKLKRYGGLWGGLALAVITYFILIKGAKGTSFLSAETVVWIKTHTLLILSISFAFFSLVFQMLTLFTRINVLKPIVLVGTFALAMAFAANDLVNFIGVPVAGLNAYSVAAASADPLTSTMGALQKSVQTNTLLLLLAGAIMVATLWLSRKARTVSKTEITLARQDKGSERFGSSILSRVIVRMVLTLSDLTRKGMPVRLRRFMADRHDQSNYQPMPTTDGKVPSFDLVRASVNLIVASAVVSFATSLKLPLSTTYVTFMVAMGTSLSDQAWGRESAVYRITGVITVVGGWFFTAFAAFSISFIFLVAIQLLKLTGIILILVLLFSMIVWTFRFHRKKEKEGKEIEALSLQKLDDSESAILKNFEQTGYFLSRISDNLGACFEAAFSADRQRLRNTRTEVERIQKWANVMVENIFETLFLLDRSEVGDTRKYSDAVRSVQAIAESHRDMIMRTSRHFENFHDGFLEVQKEELRHVKNYVTRLLWNTSIMLLRRKKVDHDYITNQLERLKSLITECDRNQIFRIRQSESTTRLSILFYGLLENSVKISRETQNLLSIFREAFVLESQDHSLKS